MFCQQLLPTCRCLTTQASTFDECGRAWVAPAAWELAEGSASGGRRRGGGAAHSPGGGAWVEDEGRLPEGARTLLRGMREAEAAAAAEGAAVAE
jgi:hypothetical protein